jgi:hypothetical protein
MTYAYDVAYKVGHFKGTVELVDLATIPPVKMGQGSTCPVPWGACVSSVTGGVVAGSDMYGQLVRETVGAAGTSKIAFAAITSGPADAKWVNKFGLPYKYVATNAETPGDITITAPAADGDNRGTFVYSGAFSGTHIATVTVAYKADISNLMGDPYAPRFASAAIDSATLAVTATYVPATGVMTVTVPASTPAGVKTTVTFPDGHTERGVAGTPLVHTLSPVWRSQYGDVINAAAADRLVAVSFDGSFIKNVYADVTGFVGADDPEPEPDPVPDPEPTQSWDDMTTHAALDDFVQHWVDDHGLVLPDNWGSMTLAGKKAWLNANVDPTP